MKVLSIIALVAASCGSYAAGPDETPKTKAEAPKRHCQVPCGIYGDKMRIDMIMEDCATIEKGMKQIVELSKAQAPNFNQIVRWTLNKDEHATAIQDRVAAYFLAQRIKAPKKGADATAHARYIAQLKHMHAITVAAMKCKQTTDPAHVKAIRHQAMQFSETYFSKEDLEHLKGHHAHEHKHK